MGRNTILVSALLCLLLTNCAEDNAEVTAEAELTSVFPCETMMCEFGCEDGACLSEESGEESGPDICETMDCEPPSICKDGECIQNPDGEIVMNDQCEVMLCEFGCEDGKCLPGDPCEIMVCEFGCEDGECVEDPNACLTPCEAGSICVEGECLPGPCFEKACGQVCNPCDGAIDDCPSIAVEFYCTAEGECVESLEEGECGEEEDPCDVMDIDCGEGMICEDGACIPVWDPCAGKQCGDICPACDANDPDCIPSEVELFCNAAGDCVESLEDEECVEDCNISGCPAGFTCWYDTCVQVLPWEPCKTDGLSCGDPCDPCNPESDFCEAEEEPHLCNADGQCVKELEGVDCPVIPTSCTGNENCQETEYCDFPSDACGLLGENGTCVVRPDSCINPEGFGACGCNGGVEANPCMLAMTGEDTFKFGGCDLGEGLEPEFECVDTTCTYEEHCTIIFEDGAGNGLGYDGFCEDLGEGEEQGNCSSVPTGILNLFSFCTDETGFTVLFAL